MRYDYICNECTEAFIKERPMGSKEPVICPVCGTGNVERLIVEMPATVMNWWNAAASEDDSGIHKRYRPRAGKELVNEH